MVSTRISFVLLGLVAAVMCVSLVHASDVGNSSTPTYPPLLFMPALTGTNIYLKLNRTSRSHFWCEKTSDWYQAWLDTTAFFPVENQCFTSNFVLAYDNVTRTSHQPAGVEAMVPFSNGGLDAIEYMDNKQKMPMWHYMMTNLTTHYGYEYGVSLRGAPYDWRYGPDHYVNAGIYDNVTQIVEEMYAANNNTPVVLMSLSMGGPYTALYLSRQPQVWKDKYIRAWMSLSGVFAGSSMAIRALVTEEPFLPSFVSPLLIQVIARTFGSTYWLLPNSNSNVFNESRVFLTTPERNYTLGDMRQLMIDSGIEYGADIFDDVSPYLNFGSPGVETVCSYGTNVTTEEAYHFSNDNGFDQAPNVTYANGDGVVLEESLAICTNWANNQTQPIHTIIQENMQHAGEVFVPASMQAALAAFAKFIGPVNATRVSSAPTPTTEKTTPTTTTTTATTTNHMSIVG
eukprot:TRINITY_DN608_c2_g1_i2.p1 TRINITY_DN608_c2_g1~~TRINITY_DN608_c2_g1_i2.p1  ORF type:complete len:456 (-),score=109.23 TRINITY_DN608_c2_g1_i2:85-1452(-)